MNTLNLVYHDSFVHPTKKPRGQSIHPGSTREPFLMLMLSSPDPAMAYADPSSIFDHWKWNETRASQPGVIWVKPTKVSKQEKFQCFFLYSFGSVS